MTGSTMLPTCLSSNVVLEQVKVPWIFRDVLSVLIRMEAFMTVDTGSSHMGASWQMRWQPTEEDVAQLKLRCWKEIETEEQVATWDKVRGCLLLKQCKTKVRLLSVVWVVYRQRIWLQSPIPLWWTFVALPGRAFPGFSTKMAHSIWPSSWQAPTTCRTLQNAVLQLPTLENYTLLAMKLGCRHWHLPCLPHHAVANSGAEIEKYSWNKWRKCLPILPTMPCWTITGWHSLIQLPCWTLRTKCCGILMACISRRLARWSWAKAWQNWSWSWRSQARAAFPDKSGESKFLPVLSQGNSGLWNLQWLSLNFLPGFRAGTACRVPSSPLGDAWSCSACEVVRDSHIARHTKGQTAPPRNSHFFALLQAWQVIWDINRYHESWDLTIFRRGQSA